MPGIERGRDRQASCEADGKWLRLLPHRFTGADRKAGYRYDISILQAEFSTTQVLDRPVHGRLFFEQVIRENLDLGRLEEIKLIFNHRHSNQPSPTCRTKLDTFTPSVVLEAGLDMRLRDRAFGTLHGIRILELHRNPSATIGKIHLHHH